MTDVVTTESTATVIVATPASATVNVTGVNSAVVIPPGVGPTGPQGPQGPEGPTPEEESFTVVGGTTGTQPTFSGAPLFVGSYVRNGDQVHFQINVDMDNITSFGSGQYYMDLPFPAKYNYLFRNACLHDVSMPRQYGLSGHVAAGQSRMLLFYTDTSGQDYAFDYNSPALLTVNDNFHISGDYIAEPLNS
jgi:hypothetical protein